MILTIKLVIFDFDGVLVDSEYISAQVTTHHLEKYGIKTTLEQTLKRFVGMHDETRRKHLAEDIGSENVGNFIKETKEFSLMAYQKLLLPLTNVEDILSNLTLPFCIASNSQKKSLTQKLAITNLKRFFKNSSLYVGSMVKNPKPAPDIYLYASEKQNVSPAECLVVEDSVHGIKAAVSAGMNVIGYYGASHCYKGYEDLLLKAGAKTVFNDIAYLPHIITRFNEELKRQKIRAVHDSDII